jgi:hypothetical protein
VAAAAHALFTTFEPVQAGSLAAGSQMSDVLMTGCREVGPPTSSRPDIDEM